MNMIRTKNLIIAAFSLLIGSLIYLLFRCKSLKMFNWLKILGLNDIINLIRNSISIDVKTLPECIIFSLPNALWLFSGILIFDCIWGKSKNYGKYFWIMLLILLAFLSEIAQYTNSITGTFDWQDLLFMIFACFFAIIFITTNRKEIENEKKHS